MVQVRGGGSGDSWDDLETRSLMNAANHHAQLIQQRKQYRSRQLIIIILLGACAAMTFFKEDLSAIFLLKDEQKGEQVQSHIHNNKHPSIIDFQKEQQEELEKEEEEEEEANEEAKEDFGSKDYYDDEDDDGKANNDDEDDDDEKVEDEEASAEADQTQESLVQESISLAQIEELQNALSAARVNFDTILQEQYGDYTASIYDKTRLLQKVFPSESSISLERFQRRLKIKLLTSQLLTSSSSSQEKTTYTWAVGGHSASAGHGNLFSQSYGAVLEQLASPVFDAVGIQFYGKNFGMGGTSSAPELAMCMNSIFGADLDVLSWDYGMTDGRNPHYYHMWAERAGRHPTNPILFTYGGGYARDVYPILERSGRGGFHMNINEARNQIPDTEAVDLDEVVKYPPGVRYFMCNGHAESGEPCSQQEYKFNITGYCNDLPGQVSWHNGFKDHFLMGSLMASFVVDNLMEVMNEMTSAPASHQDEGEETDGRWLRKRRVEEEVDVRTSGDEEDSDPNQDEEEEQNEGSDGVAPSMTKAYLDYLLDLEKQDKAAFLASPPTSVIGPFGDNIGAENYKHFLRSNAFCHTARLPAESRYNGLVTESGIVSPYVHAGRRDYIEEGYEEGKLPEPRPDDENKAPLLVYNIRDSRNICEHGKIDSKDAFAVRYTDQWSTTILPNDSEKEAFSNGDMSSEATEGIIMLCMVRFDWRNNPEDFVSTPSMIVNATATDGIVVNDVKVTGYVETGEEDCSVIKHDDGFSFPASSSGQYKIKFRVPSQYVNGTYYLSSLVVV